MEGRVEYAVVELAPPGGLAAGEGGPSRLRWYRQRRFASAAEAARAAGVPVTSYKRYEADMTLMPASALIKVCAALELSADELLGLPARKAPSRTRCDGQPAPKTPAHARYDGLPAADRRIVDGVVEALAERERERDEQRRAARDGARHEGMARFYERRLYDELAAQPAEAVDVLVAGSPAERAAFFRDYVESELRAARQRRLRPEGGQEPALPEKEEAQLQIDVRKTLQAWKKIHQPEFQPDEDEQGQGQTS